MASLLGVHAHKGASITLTRGDYAPLMKRMEDHLNKAKVRRVGGGNATTSG